MEEEIETQRAKVTQHWTWHLNHDLFGPKATTPQCLPMVTSFFQQYLLGYGTYLPSFLIHNFKLSHVHSNDYFNKNVFLTLTYLFFNSPFI